jgi:hypothetical protein
MNKDVELLKVQILADFYHTRISSWFSLFASILIAFSIVITTLFYERYIDPITYEVAICAFVAFFFLRLWMLSKQYSRDIDRLDDLLKRIENGKPLPPLRELKENLFPRIDFNVSE